MDDHEPLNDMTERPLKRPRLTFTPDSPEDTEVVSEEWDLQAARAQNDLRLKSIFEGIFAKYGNDFSEVGDEIDLETGEIVVNNGHLQAMHEETDIGNKEKPWETDPFGSDDEEAHAQDEDAVETHDAASEHSPQNELLGSGTAGNDASAFLCHSALASSGPGSGIPASSPSVSKEKPSPALHHIEKDPGPRDPLWQAPELPPLFTTPKLEERRANLTPQLPNISRQPSPPGSGSLWTVPRRRQPRSRQDGKALATPTPSKSRSRAKRKHQSSPVARDWSFAKVADGDESDDPLQEEWPSSPLPFPRQVKTTNKRDFDCQIKPVDENRNIESLITSRIDASRHLSAQADLSVHDQPGTEPERHDQGNHSEQSPITSDVAVQYHNLPYDSPSPVSPHSRTTAHSPLKYSPIKPHTKFSPDDVKLIVCMRYAQGRTWKEVQNALPGRTLTQIYQWNQVHWSDRRACPPELSAPWSQAELKTLESLAGRSGLSWLQIMTELSERSQAEVEFELLRSWVGDDVWAGEQRATVAMTAPNTATFESVQYETESKVIIFDPDDDEPGHDEEKQSETSATAVEESKVDGPTLVEEYDVELPSPRSHGHREFEDLVDSDDDHDVNNHDEVMLVSGASSPSKLSAILLESPLPSRYVSVTPKKSPLRHHSLV
ncbi:uncharacterized protein N7458_004976 [Penicillium daleae]|uniref:Myb-like domain-containing protein n=1 Tax=Penicillium daleae TaxID=63821 RepID=A0AAD6C7F2_9EURO|nr:uncharacterized protein N7458_004976 [Penicillium daleae]KAJ5454020.1 hypothetical protein N7458_004976 [Penicillium daleae]